MGGKNGVPELVSLSVSAWSLKARFALKYHCIKYRTTPYLPLFGEFMLRLRLWEWRRKLTVPVMFTPNDGVLMQSYDIAQWADRHSARPDAVRLFPEGKEAEVSRWNTKSDVVLYFGRSLLVEATLADKAALRQLVPSGLRWLGPLGLVLVTAIARRLQNKYRAEASSTCLDKALEVLREAQSVLRTHGSVGADGERHLVAGELSYADFAMAVAVSALKPLGPPYATGARPQIKELQPYQEEFADLIAWRDALFSKYFPLDTQQRTKSKAN
ncbi:hypothetical protein VOLCADRAFT_108017 [Volvox carteri f. nagariensis]|uniref:GST N-terminal domain-containing protein n=1 Tax=Volvox carteri f. nagariensis TaxID=3068 RepID=D8UHS0_VOLCA|nr:uncharacterized protein VOLCADRAFT_108017 [Volvox carteri f. nagariensis]EFJ40730.1 hypothetical protein VOLCADRAFT_108017 [Volvox carteri f. nagariensis]|eukprot:XP_002958196.1 hypothetical protein VOLCADRAFT_108017 [Volvox carteri f. nagariensis]